MKTTTLRQCPFHGCNIRIPGSVFACRRHWFSLNRAERLKVYDSYGRWQAGELSLEELRAIQQQVLGTRGTA